MISHSTIASWLVSLYQDGSGCDFYDPGKGDHGICWGLTKTPEEYVYKLRGSKSLEDWLRDLVALATPFEHNLFGPVHPGFLIGMDCAVDEMIEQWDGKTPITIAGHSLGAGRASIAVAMFLARKVPASLMRRVVFGEPKPGMPQLAKYISAVPGTSYRNGTGFHHDIVTDVPLTLPPVENYVRAAPLTMVSNPPTNILAENFDVFAFHHMPLYAAALAKLGV